MILAVTLLPIAQSILRVVVSESRCTVSSCNWAERKKVEREVRTQKKERSESRSILDIAGMRGVYYMRVRVCVRLRG
jgi:hypothetical protein